MAISSITRVIESDIKTVWGIVTNLYKYDWRSDLSRIEVLDEKHFIEYTKDGFVTKFTITKTEPYKVWEFNMENSNIMGHWVGVFSENEGKTKVEFTEDVRTKKILMNPFVKGYLKRQQLQYISDLVEAIKASS